MVNMKRTPAHFRPVSLSNSRKTASSGFSPGSRAPPGNIQELVPSCQRCFTRRISVPSVRTTAAAARGRSNVAIIPSSSLLHCLIALLPFSLLGGCFLLFQISFPYFSHFGNALAGHLKNQALDPNTAFPFFAH